MKKICLILVIPLCFLRCSSQQKGYTIEGSDASLVDGQYVYLVDGVDWSVLDSTLVENSSIRIEGTNRGSEVAYLYMGESSDPDQLMQVSWQMFLEPGRIQLFIDPGDEMFRAKGTPMNDTYLKIRGEKELTDVIRKNHNALGCVLLGDILSISSKPEIESLMAEFPEDMKRHPLYLQVVELIEPIKADLGMPYYDIIGMDIDGNAVSLGSIVEREGVKYILLDFWASWCGPCREEIPNLVELYARYKNNGFEIYGMSFDSKAKRWRETLGKENMAWTNVIAAFEKGPRFSPVWQAYGVDGIPWNYLIDASDGMIVAKNLHGDELKAKLGELF